MKHNTYNNIQNGDAMSGNEPTGARRRRRTKVAGWVGAAGLCATAASLIPVGGGHIQAAFAGESEGMVCTDGATSVDVNNVTHRAFNMVADDGYTSEPDGNAIYDWGYGMTGKGFQLPGPVLCANQGEIIDVTLTNSLEVNTSIQFPGQIGVTSGGNPVGPQADGSGNLVALVPEANANGGSVSYSFTAANAGTYVYESGSDPQLQVQMGLFGALVIRPTYNGLPIHIGPDDIKGIPYEDGTVAQTTNGTYPMSDQAAIDAANDAACAYASATDASKCDPLAIYQKGQEHENILILSEIDPGVHTFMEQNVGIPANLVWAKYTRGYEAHYFMINGRSMPDTVAPNNAPWMPTQPYGALAHVQPWDITTNPLDALLRYVAVGNAGYDFHPHSNHEHVIAEDGALMKGSTGNDNTEEKFNILVGSGSTADATFRWTNQEGYSDTATGSQCGSTAGCRVPVAWPQGLNLQEGDFWSGSPYLGESGVLNPGILTKTQCGEYYHVAHNHDLTEVTNYGITFGGMLTLIKVEPPTQAQIDLNLDCG